MDIFTDGAEENGRRGASVAVATPLIGKILPPLHLVTYIYFTLFLFKWPHQEEPKCLFFLIKKRVYF